ncbi:CDP-alcohol phosphatidyltransferase family protein [Candidatus Bathyarchaeota archaeon]|nr:CDP-alcohol phosphatidyltransferase family protein [Candidatus Bathyarchaeota archaeon]
MVSSNLKKHFESMFKTLVIPLGKIGIKPNHLTVLGLITALVTAWFYSNHVNNSLMLVFAGIMILVSGLLDALDGILARSTDQVTSFGGFFDSVIDRYSDLVIISGIIIGKLIHPVIGLAALIGSVMVSYTRSRAEAEGVSMSGVGFAERAERMIFLSFSSIVSFFWIDALKWGIILLTLLSNFTVIQRILYFKKEVEKN